MPADSPRILELRRRVYNDPSSIAFAQLGEELRRAGAYEEAVDVCLAGLARHAGYLSARVTLGRALVELGRLDEAEAELDVVVRSAPDNLAAIRALAEIHQRRGDLAAALGYYRRALELARHDPDLEETVVRMEKAVAPPAPVAEPPVSIEALFDFDRLVEQLGADTPPQVAALDARAAGGWLEAPAGSLEPSPDEDPLAAIEDGLRRRETRPVAVAVAADADPEAQALRELERWLEALRASSR